MVKLEKVGTEFKQTKEKQGLIWPLYLMRTELLLLQISVKEKNIMRFLSRTLKWNEQNMRKKIYLGEYLMKWIRKMRTIGLSKSFCIIVIVTISHILWTVSTHLKLRKYFMKENDGKMLVYFRLKIGMKEGYELQKFWMVMIYLVILGPLFRVS